MPWSEEDRTLPDRTGRGKRRGRNLYPKLCSLGTILNHHPRDRSEIYERLISGCLALQAMHGAFEIGG